MASTGIPPVPYLPGPAIDRALLEGWRRWTATRHDFVPAPRMTSGEYGKLSAHRRWVHDLHRLATHSNLAVQETPMSARVLRIIRRRLTAGALKRLERTRSGLMINGGGFQGKTETVCEGVARFEEQWLAMHRYVNPDAVPGTRDLIAPVAYVQTPTSATPKKLCRAILDFYGEPYGRHELDSLTRMVKTSMREHSTRVLVLDDITRLKMHREADQDTLDLIRELMSMSVTLILIGVDIPHSGLLREGRRDKATGEWVFPPVPDRGRSPNDEAATQTERRFSLVDLDRFRYDTAAGISAWMTHLAGVEHQLRLLLTEPGCLTSGHMPEYLFGRTGGIVGVLERLIEEACQEAIETGAERITIELLDDLEMDLAGVVGRDRQAGEIPDLPQPTRVRGGPAGNPKAKGRNTVFDDRGVHPDR
jgi:hypothetical protein